MLIIPAIDIQDGRCVRLKQGQFDQVTQFSSHPVERAKYYKSLGAQRLHIVDLDGAKTGTMQQLPLIKDMISAGLNVQAGGGIRSLEQAQACYDAGISQLVIGSIAITQPELTLKIIQAIKPQHIILAFDVRVENHIPKPATHGWQTDTEVTLWEMVAYYQEFGITTILCTDIACDGMMNGPNFDLYQQAAQKFPHISWQASGGIRNQDDIAQLNGLGIAAAILGLTLYQDNFNLSKTINNLGRAKEQSDVPDKPNHIDTDEPQSC